MAGGGCLGAARVGWHSPQLFEYSRAYRRQQQPLECTPRSIAFNDTAHGDCRLKPYGDFPWIDGDTPSPEEFSCQGWDDVGNAGDNGGIEWIDYSIDAFDYLGDYCNTGTMSDRGTELDWLRFFWDLDRESTGGEGMSFYTMIDLYGGALPYAWSSSDAHDDLESAYATTYSSEWSAQETLNGVHR